MKCGIQWPCTCSHPLGGSHYISMLPKERLPYLYAHCTQNIDLFLKRMTNIFTFITLFPNKQHQLSEKLNIPVIVRADYKWKWDRKKPQGANPKLLRSPAPWRLKSPHSMELSKHTHLCPCSDSCRHLGVPGLRRSLWRLHWAPQPWTDLKVRQTQWEINRILCWNSYKEELQMYVVVIGQESKIIYIFHVKLFFWHAAV